MVDPIELDPARIVQFLEVNRLIKSNDADNALQAINRGLSPSFEADLYDDLETLEVAEQLIDRVIKEKKGTSKWEK